MEHSAAQKMVTDLMAQHLPSDAGWRFEFDRGTKRFGATHWRKVGVGGDWQPHKITLSRKLTALNSPERVQQTILHEIAHALAGAGNGHNNRWLRIARSIGYTGGRTCGADTVMGEPAFIGSCPGCDLKVKRDRRKEGNHAPCYRAGRPSRVVWTRNPAAMQERALVASMARK